MPGIEVRSGGAPLVRNSEISDGKSNGIYVHNKGIFLFHFCLYFYYHESSISSFSS